MPWRCPACRTELRHDSADSRPRTDETYRCHVCRLEFIYDEASEKLVIAPLDTDDHVDPTYRRKVQHK
jgi:rubredoxin